MLDEVATQWRSVLGSLPASGEIVRAQDFARCLNLRTKLAWQVWRSMHAESAVELLEHLPGEPGLNLFWSALDRKASSREASRALRRAVDRFRELVRVHAQGDDDALRGMLAGLAPDQAERMDLEHREGAFQAARHLWGVQARTTLALSILHPGRAPNLMDVVALRGTFGLQRLRADLPWILARVGCQPEKGDPTPGESPDSPRRESIVRVEPGEPSLIPELCSRPMPGLRTIPITATQADIELLPGPVGASAACDIVMGDVFRNLPRFRTGPRPPDISPIIFTPCERYVHDLIVHRGAEPAGPFRVEVFGDPRGQGLDNEATRQPLAIRVRAELCGRGPEALRLPEVPHYQRLVSFVHDRLGWSGRGEASDYSVHRITIAYPITPSIAVVRFDLPEV